MELEEWKNTFSKDMLPENRLQYDKSFFDEITLNKIFKAFSGFFVVVDYNALEYIYVSPQFEREMGYKAGQLYKGGIEFMAAITHPEDLAYLKTISAESINVLHQLPIEKRADYSFSTDYRLKHANGNYLRWLHQTLEVKLDKEGYIQYSFIMYSNISNHKLTHQLVAALRCLEHDDSYLWMMPETHYRKTKPLSDREKQVLQHIYHGTSKQEIAKRLGITVLTLETHRKNIRKKLGARSTAELIKYALNSGLV